MGQKRVAIMMIATISFLYTPIAQTAPSSATSTSLTYQGRILKNDGSPFQYNNTSFLFKITDPSGQCVIYQEQFNGIDMTNSGGVFDVPIGAGSIQYISAGSAVIDIFNNSGASYQCGSCSLTAGNVYTCSPSAASPYVPQATDSRLLRVAFYDGTGWNTISPDNVIRSVPYAGFANSAQKLGTNTAGDFVLKTDVNNSGSGSVSCNSGSFLTWDATTQKFGCSTVSGANGGTVTNIATGAGLTGGPITTTGTIALSTSGVTSGTYGSANQVPVIQVDSYGRITSATSTTISGVAPGGAAGGDLGGNYPNPTVAGLSGKPLVVTAPANGQFLKFDGTNWINTAIQQSDISGLATTLNGYVPYSSIPTCNSASTTLTFISATGTFSCTPIAITGAKVSGDIAGNAAGFTGSLNGDVTGTQTATVVGALQGNAIAPTTPTANQVLQFNGTQWAPATISTAPSGSAGGDLTGSYPNPTLKAVGTAGTYYKVTTDANGRVTSGSASLSAADITGTIGWSQISSTPTTLSGYGISDGVKNAGSAVSLQSGTDAAKGAPGTVGRFYAATDSKIIYFDDGTSWITVASNAGAGGTVTSVSVSSANGFAGSVANSGTTPAITLSTNVTGMVKGNGTALSAATAGTDYSAGTAALGTGLLKSTTGTGALSIAGPTDITTALGYTPLNKAGDVMSGLLGLNGVTSDPVGLVAGDKGK
ncbi:MAG: beta strand repeat-containing protein, partial [Bacillota bacterium]